MNFRINARFEIATSLAVFVSIAIMGLETFAAGFGAEPGA